MAYNIEIIKTQMISHSMNKPALHMIEHYWKVSSSQDMHVY